MTSVAIVVSVSVLICRRLGTGGCARVPPLFLTSSLKTSTVEQVVLHLQASSESVHVPQMNSWPHLVVTIWACIEHPPVVGVMAKHRVDFLLHNM